MTWIVTNKRDIFRIRIFEIFPHSEDGKKSWTIVMTNPRITQILLLPNSTSHLGCVLTLTTAHTTDRTFSKLVRIPIEMSLSRAANYDNLYYGGENAIDKAYNFRLTLKGLFRILLFFPVWDNGNVFLFDVMLKMPSHLTEVRVFIDAIVFEISTRDQVCIKVSYSVVTVRSYRYELRFKDQRRVALRF